MNNPFLYRPQPSSQRAADFVLAQIASHHEWNRLFSQGKMLGVLIYAREPLKYICAYSGVVNGLEDPEHFFVPPIYDLQNPDDFYLQKDADISAINQEIAGLMLKREAVANDSDKQKGQLLDTKITELRVMRKQKSIDLQLEIFSHFNVRNATGQYKNIVQIFGDAKRGLPPGGTGECAAPRLLQYALQHGLEPLEIVEFWYGASPNATLRVHGQYYPACIEKCSPLLRFMSDGMLYEEAPEPELPSPIEHLHVWYEDEHLLVVEKPAGVLSVPGKVLGDSVEAYLHRLCPEVKGPMLVHRLDQSTSGIMLAAKNANVHKLLQQAFETRQIHKEYLAWLDGEVKSREGVISLPICPNPDDRPRQIVDFIFGKKAVSHYKVLKHQDCKTLVRFTPFTGRTHQLRLHAASHFGLGHPIVGDRLYGGSPHSRLLLHASKLQFEHPISGRLISVESKGFVPEFIF